MMYMYVSNICSHKNKKKRKHVQLSNTVTIVYKQFILLKLVKVPPDRPKAGRGRTYDHCNCV